MGTQGWTLLTLAVALNLTLGGLVAVFKITLYLDSVGTVLTAALLGPGPAALAGALGVLLLTLTSPTAFPFFPVACLVGLCAGWAARRGAFRRLPTALVWGIATGTFSAALAAPIATLMFGGVTGGGTDLLVALFRADGKSALEAAFLQGILVDPIDKAFTFLMISLALRSLPHRSLTPFPLGPRNASTRVASQRVYRPQPQARCPRSQPEIKLRPASRLAMSRTSTLHAASFGLKILAYLVSFLAVSVSSDLKSGASLLVIIIAYQTVLAPAVCLRALKTSAILVAPLCLSLIAIHGLFGSEASGTVPFAGLDFSLDGLRYAQHLILKISAAVFLALVCCSSTDLNSATSFLTRFRVPYPLIYCLLGAATLVPELQSRFARIKLAQEARGLSFVGGNLKTRIHRLYATLIPTLGSYFGELPARAANLQSRGFLCRKDVGKGGGRETAPRSTSLFANLMLLGQLLLCLGYLWWT